MLYDAPRCPGGVRKLIQENLREVAISINDELLNAPLTLRFSIPSRLNKLLGFYALIADIRQLKEFMIFPR